LPHALEQVLAYKSEREREIGSTMDSALSSSEPERAPAVSRFDRDSGVPSDEDEDEETAAGNQEQKGKQAQKKKKKKKKSRKQRQMEMEQQLERQRNQVVTNGVGAVDGGKIEDSDIADVDVDDVEIEYVPEPLNLPPTDPLYTQFAYVFESFRIVDPSETNQEEEVPKPEINLRKVPKTLDADDMIEETVSKNQD
jgi:hypothetical protein